ncbi:MAG: hydroxymethylglutaryl-CoA lyase [Deltaproteobacteria bacterium]|nr:hydroxymethylglutaryl-CoA lyase [Deltaproteobacteria bacterium]
MSERHTSAPDVGIYEVGPRDGLQNEVEFVPTVSKLELIALLVASGLRRIEVASFVSPSWIPQLADADDVVAGLPRSEGVSFGALVPNEKGYERFRAAGQIDIAGTFISASETHNQKNVNCSIDDQLTRLAPVFESARADGVAVRAYLSTVCGCPYEGEVAVSAVVDLARKLIERGAAEISLGDTIGIGSPNQVRALVRAVASEVPIERVALHLHDTYGRALANAQAGFEEGVRIFDSSLAGLGGCPYAPGASGNVATEDLVDLFEREGIRTGIDLDSLVDASAWLERDVLERPLPGRVFRARLGERQRAHRLD